MADIASTKSDILRDDLQKIESTDVTTVKSLFIAYIKKYYFVLIILPAIVLLVAIWLTIVTLIPHILIFTLFGLLAVYGYQWQKLMGSFLEKFASETGYSYEDTAGTDSVSGVIFDFGSNQNLSKIVTGKYFNQDTRLFIFNTTVGSGKSRHVERFSVLEISFDTMLPNILLDNHLNNISAWYTIGTRQNETKLSLEGDFQKYFTLYVAKQYEVEALQIFTPEIMQMFINEAKNMGVEMYKNKVYLYYPGEISKKEQLVSVYTLAKEIILRLGPTFITMKADVEDMSQYAKLA